MDVERRLSELRLRGLPEENIQRELARENIKHCEHCCAYCEAVPEGDGARFLCPACMEKMVACDYCSTWIEEDDAQDGELGECLCSYCAQIYRCEHCGDSFHGKTDPSTTVDDMSLCPGCFESEGFECHECDERHLKEEFGSLEVEPRYERRAYVVGGSIWFCSSCASEFTCWSCEDPIDPFGNYAHNYDMKEASDVDDSYCHDCCPSEDEEDYEE